MPARTRARAPTASRPGPDRAAGRPPADGGQGGRPAGGRRQGGRSAGGRRRGGRSARWEGAARGR
ncbi:hypothetical protein D8771_04045 [Streptomyces albus]|uniref:Uncharacterized protein n=1 Tax=Streptomyces albus TaxID=1888 RepID=A0A8H1LLU0_9ACTN|nr:hypothetical protein D8771_04045 [Streptomyces albus]